MGFQIHTGRGTSGKATRNTTRELWPANSRRRTLLTGSGLAISSLGGYYPKTYWSVRSSVFGQPMSLSLGVVSFQSDDRVSGLKNNQLRTFLLSGSATLFVLLSGVPASVSVPKDQGISSSSSTPWTVLGASRTMYDLLAGSDRSLYVI